MTTNTEAGIKIYDPLKESPWKGTQLPENLVKVRPILKEHFGEEAPLEDIFEKILQLGGTTNEALALCTWEDLQKCGLPILLAKRVANEFRSNVSSEKEYVGKKEVARMNIAQLLEAYNFNDTDSSVAKRLQALSGGKKFIIFNPDSTVDVGASYKLLNELREGFSPRKIYVVGGNVMELFAVGEKPNTLADENPLYPGRPLRPDGTCDQLNRSWDGVPPTVRQFVYAIATENRLGHDQRHDIMDWAISNPDKLQQRYPGTFVVFKELERLGKLPPLKVAMSDVARYKQKQNPFTKD